MFRAVEMSPSNKPVYIHRSPYISASDRKCPLLNVFSRSSFDDDLKLNLQKGGCNNIATITYFIVKLEYLIFCRKNLKDPNGVQAPLFCQSNKEISNDVCATGNCLKLKWKSHTTLNC